MPDAAGPEPLPPSTAAADVLALLGRPGLVGGVVAQGAVTQVLCGPARTLRLAPGPGSFEPVYDLLSSDLSGGIVVVEAAGVAGAVWGEILSFAALGSGAVGAVVDGATRDHEAVAEQGFGLWGARHAVVGPNGQAHVVAVGAGADIGGVTVGEGDVVLADADGVVVLPAADAAFLLAAARHYAQAEAEVVRRLAAGVLLTEAYKVKKEAVAALVSEALAR